MGTEIPTCKSCGKIMSAKSIRSVIIRSLLESSVVTQVPRRELKESPKARVGYERLHKDSWCQWRKMYGNQEELEI